MLSYATATHAFDEGLWTRPYSRHTIRAVVVGGRRIVKPAPLVDIVVSPFQAGRVGPTPSATCLPIAFFSLHFQ